MINDKGDIETRYEQEGEGVRVDRVFKIKGPGE